MTSQSSRIVPHATGKDRAQYGIAKVRTHAFSEIIKRWRKRKIEGMTQAEFAEALGRDTGWLSKNLKGPSNMTLKTFARMVEALDGEAEILVHDLRAPSPHRDNYDAYADADDGQQSSDDAGFASNENDKPQAELAHAN